MYSVLVTCIQFPLHVSSQCSGGKRESAARGRRAPQSLERRLVSCVVQNGRCRRVILPEAPVSRHRNPRAARHCARLNESSYIRATTGIPINTYGSQPWARAETARRRVRFSPRLPRNSLRHLRAIPSRAPRAFSNRHPFHSGANMEGRACQVQKVECSPPGYPPSSSPPIG